MALVGTLTPIALQATVAPAHACCRRNQAHSCHAAAVADSSQAFVHGLGCCNHNCCRAGITSQRARRQSAFVAIFSQETNIATSLAVSDAVPTEFLAVHSSRAPPPLSIA